MGTGVAEASHPSTDLSADNDEEEEEAKTPALTRADAPDAEYPSQPCGASRVPLKGRSRQQLSGFSPPVRRARQVRDVRRWPKSQSHDTTWRAPLRKARKGYVMLINNKRCTRPGRWRRGSLWGQDVKWLLGCSSRMQDHFEDPPHQPKPPLASDRTTSVLTTEKLQPNCGKLPADVEPSASSNLTADDGLPTDGARKVAEAALPDALVKTENKDRKEHREDSTKNDANKSHSKEDIHPITRKYSRIHVEKIAQMGKFQEPAD